MVTGVLGVSVQGHLFALPTEALQLSPSHRRCLKIVWSWFSLWWGPAGVTSGLSMSLSPHSLWDPTSPVAQMDPISPVAQMDPTSPVAQMEGS